MITIEDIIKKYLDDNNYDGLCNNDCGCSKDNLFPCDSPQGDCRPAYKCKCNHECKLEYADECYTQKKGSKCWMDE